MSPYREAIVELESMQHFYNPPIQWGPNFMGVIILPVSNILHPRQGLCVGWL